MALGVQVAPLGGSEITLLEDEVKLAGGRTEGTLSGTVAEAPGTPSFKMPLLKIEDEGSRGGRLREDGHRVGGAGASLGSAGQSPSSPLSSRSSPSSSLPSPSISPGRSFPNSTPDLKPTSDLEQNNLQQNYPGNKDGFYIPGSQVSGQLGERNTMNPSFTGSTGSSPGHRKEEMKSILSSTSGDLLGSLKENSVGLLTGDQTLKPSFGMQSIIKPTGAPPPAADLTGSKAGSTAGPRAGPPPGVGENEVGQSGVRRENLSHTENGGIGSCASPSRGVTGGVVTHDRSQDLSRAEDGRVGLRATLNTETKTSRSSELPQRTTVRRAMSDCSHLSVPTVMAGTYPTGMGGSPVLPNMPNFAMIGTVCPPRAPYPHVAVRRSLTVTDGTEAAAAMATMMSPPLMTSHVLPSSPPPKRHHGSCETNFLLAVPTPSKTSANSTQDNKLNLMGKSFFLCACVSVGMDMRKHEH